jgi:hypothetical protein
MDDTLDELKDANFCIHLDLASYFWQVRAREEDVHKTAFQSPYSLMEGVAMAFGLCDAPVMFQRMMNDITVYLDDVCVYSRTLEEHLEHLRLVLPRFK